MKIKDYEVYIKSSSSDVREVKTISGECAFIGVYGESYSIHIKNNNHEYRIWASLHIDGVPAMLDGWGRIAKPDSPLFWDGFQIDQNTVREFVFVENEKESVALSKGITKNFGFIEIVIVRENIKWHILSPPEPLVMNFMTTGMGEFKESKIKQVKIKFNWGGPKEIIKIPYGTVTDLIEKQIIDENLYSESSTKHNKAKVWWYKITVEKNFWDSFNFPPDKKTISYAVIDPQLTVSLTKGEKNTASNIEWAQIILSDVERDCIAKLTLYIVSNPIDARKGLENSTVVPHVGHYNPIYVKIERFDNSELANGTTILSWNCNAMFAESGLLKQIMEFLKI